MGGGIGRGAGEILVGLDFEIEFEAAYRIRLDHIPYNEYISTGPSLLLNISPCYAIPHCCPGTFCLLCRRSSSILPDDLPVCFLVRLIRQWYPIINPSHLSISSRPEFCPSRSNGRKRPLILTYHIPAPVNCQYRIIHITPSPTR